jgi:hypothetical protein
VLFKELGLSKVLRWAHLGLLDTQQVITMKVRKGAGLLCSSCQHSSNARSSCRCCAVASAELQTYIDYIGTARDLQWLRTALFP